MKLIPFKRMRIYSLTPETKALGLLLACPLATNKNKESCTLTVEQSWLSGVDHTNSFYPYGTYFNHSLIFHTSSRLPFLDY